MRLGTIGYDSQPHRNRPRPGASPPSSRVVAPRTATADNERGPSRSRSHAVRTSGRQTIAQPQRETTTRYSVGVRRRHPFCWTLVSRTIWAASVLGRVVGAADDTAVRQEIQKTYDRARAKTIAARTLADLDAIHNWLDTPDCVLADYGQPRRTWADMRVGLATPVARQDRRQSRHKR
jgi:hypothetical protein